MISSSEKSNPASRSVPPRSARVFVVVFVTRRNGGPPERDHRDALARLRRNPPTHQARRDLEPGAVPMLVLILIVLAVLIGFVAGGSLRPFEHVRVHWWGAALVGMLLQALPLAGSLGTAAVIGSYVLLLGFALV